MKQLHFILFIALLLSSCASWVWVTTPKEEQQQWTEFFNNDPSKDQVIQFLSFPDQIDTIQGYEVWYWDYGVQTQTNQSPTKTTQNVDIHDSYIYDGVTARSSKTTTGGNEVVNVQKKYCKVVWKDDKVISHEAFKVWGKPKNVTILDLL